MILEFKKILKKNCLIYAINAALKARQNSLKIKTLYEDYRKKADSTGVKYNEKKISEQVKIGLIKRKVYIQKKEPGKLRIFWVGANYNQDMSGFLQGLKTFGEVVIFKNAEGGYGLLWPQTSKTKLSAEEVIKTNSEILLKQVELALKQGNLDLLMGQMWADVLDVSVLVKIQKMGIPTINVSMDDKLPDLWRREKGKLMGSAGLANGLNLVLTTSPDTCLWYLIEGCPAIYWPLASDPDMFYPRGEKIYDVVFVGSKYGIRGKLVGAIRKAGVKVEAYGQGWPNGFINAQKIAEVFGKAKIILGTGNVAYNKDILTIKLRDFDATMSDALYITHRNPDLLKLFKEGKEIECYDEINECIEKIKFYLAHPEKLEAIADAGYKKARENYTWEKNIGNALRIIGLIK